jgi:hypothetical protein
MANMVTKLELVAYICYFERHSIIQKIMIMHIYTYIQANVMPSLVIIVTRSAIICFQEAQKTPMTAAYIIWLDKGYEFQL